MSAVRLLENSSRLIEATLDGATLTTSGENVIYVNTATANPTLTIATLDITQQRFPIYIKDTAGNLSASNILTISCESAETIDGASTYLINEPYGAVTLSTDGTNCFVANASNTATTIPFVPFNQVITPSDSGDVEIVRVTTFLIDFTLNYNVTNALLSLTNNSSTVVMRANFNLLFHPDQNVDLSGGVTTQKVPILITPTPTAPALPTPAYMPISGSSSVYLTADGAIDTLIALTDENSAYRLLLDVTQATTSGSGIHLELDAFRGWSGVSITGWYIPIGLPE